jgi:hypothetical protein
MGCEAVHAGRVGLMGCEAVLTGIRAKSAKVILKVMDEVKGKLRIESSLQQALIKRFRPGPRPFSRRSASAQAPLRLKYCFGDIMKLN